MGRVICDYIAGMTDKYAVHTYETIFIPAGLARPGLSEKGGIEVAFPPCVSRRAQRPQSH